MENCIRVQGARVNNLKNISVEIPRDKLVVLTGLSGSGKSSLAFDTIFAEGQRRYVESLSSYARMFLGQMDKPDVDSIDGLSPAISIDQKTTSRNPRSTVGTVTEIYDYLRLLWARCGTPHCPKCGKEIRRQTVDQIVDQIMGLPERTKFQILSPVVRGKKGEHQKIFEDARRGGYARVRVDGSLYELTEDISPDKNKKHHIDVVVDRLVMKPDLARRLTDSVETALSLSGGLVILNEVDGDKDTIFSQNYACEDCGISLPELSPRMFSFNNPYGACPVCSGLGTQLVADPDLVIPDWDKSILDGAIQASGFNNVKDDSIARMYFEALAKKYHFSLTTPMKDLPKDALHAVLYGTGKENLTIYYERANGRGTLERPFEGVLNNVSRRLSETQSDAMRKELEECILFFTTIGGEIGNEIYFDSTDWLCGDRCRFCNLSANQAGKNSDLQRDRGCAVEHAPCTARRHFGRRSVDDWHSARGDFLFSPQGPLGAQQRMAWRVHCHLSGFGDHHMEKYL